MDKLPQLYITDKILKYTILPLIPRTVKPNYVTMVRFLTTPLVVWLLWKGSYVWGLSGFMLVAFTDALDGALARTRNQITTWGKIYDPLADKILICSVIYVVVLQHLHAYLALSVVALELLIIITALLKRSQGKELQANWWGKFKMIFQVAGVVFLILSIIFHAIFLMMFSSLCFVVALLLGIISLFTYSI
jgi:CDP-diacylglycerol--glycerol-3-phosphate 3-phosphatidyltransferase